MIEGWEKRPDVRRWKRRYWWHVGAPTIGAVAAFGAIGLALSLWGPVSVLVQYGAGYVVGKVAMRRLDALDRRLEGGAK